MSRWRAVAAIALLVCAGCADGGQRGTGISSFEGNVIAVEHGSAQAPASADGVGGIIVTVEGTDLQTQTDSQGAFSLRGTFAGDTALRFARAGDGLDARYSVNAPAGGTTTLHDVTVQAASGEVVPAAVYVAFEGRAVGLDCAMNRLVCVSVAQPAGEADEDDTYVVDLTDSTVHDSAGHALGCDAFAPGDTMAIDGAYLRDGTIGQADITRH
ncbi:MAG TPA: hypothetical protein VGK30_17245 [Candidatus Binatia bacterium]|jgi:hypothetical protein